MCTLYKLTFASGKSYIGQTIRTMKIRLAQHKRSAMNDSQYPVHCAWRKYGEPIVEIIGEYESDSDLNLAEISAISTYGTLSPDGYNVAYGGHIAPSKNPEVRAKMSAKLTGRIQGQSELDAKSDAAKLNWADEEYRAKVSIGLKATWTDEKRLAASKRINAMWEKRKAEGWTMSESHRDKLRTKVVSDVARKNMSDAAKGKPKAKRSSETKAKLSESTKKAWQNKEVVERRVEAIKAAWDDSARSEMSKKASDGWKDPVIRERRLAAMRAAKEKNRNKEV